MGGGVPPGHAQGHAQGVPHHPTPPPHRCTHDVRHAGLRRTGLWAQGGSRGPSGREPGSEAAWRLLCLRPSSPGHRSPPKAGSGNDWIGSRSKPAQGGLGVQDLVGLSLRCARPVIRPDGTGTGRERDGRDGNGTGTGRTGRERDGNGTDGTGPDGADAWGRLNVRSGGARCSLLHLVTDVLVNLNPG